MVVTSGYSACFEEFWARVGSISSPSADNRSSNWADLSPKLSTYPLTDKAEHSVHIKDNRILPDEHLIPSFSPLTRFCTSSVNKRTVGLGLACFPRVVGLIREMCDEYHAVAFLIPSARGPDVLFQYKKKSECRTCTHTSIISVVGAFILRSNDCGLAVLGHCEST